jgi:hypothetical protein
MNTFNFHPGSLGHGGLTAAPYGPAWLAGDARWSLYPNAATQANQETMKHLTEVYLPFGLA